MTPIWFLISRLYASGLFNSFGTINMIKQLSCMLLCIIIFAPIANAEPIFEASTENVTDGEEVPKASLIDFLMATVAKQKYNDADIFSECLKNKHIKKSQRNKLFRAITLPRLKKSEIMYFVRPALEPYCMAFYGAHGFHYWLIIESNVQSKKSYRILYDSIGDEFAVLPSIHNRYFDIIDTGHWAMGFNSKTLHYNGHKYVPFSCKESTFSNEGRDIKEMEVPCTSEDKN